MTMLLPFDVRKEVRALALPWLASLAVIVLGGLGVPGPRGFEVAAYFLGICALGGLSFGHEYTYGTMPLFLSLPASRQRLYVVKFAVLALMLLSINLVMIFFNGDVREFEGLQRPLWLAMACCLFIGPWMTMVSRNPLAGAIFGISLPATVYIAYQWTYFMWTGSTWGDDLNVVTVVVIAAAAIAAVAGWRKFMRLEAADGGRQMRLLSWSAAATADSLTRQRPTWLLIKKELGLHQIPLALALFLIGGSLIAMTLKGHVDHMVEIYDVISVFYCGSTVLVIGCVASAEERQLGTHEWQLLLPISSAWQWTIKVLVAVGVMFVISIVLPSPFLYWMNGRIDIVPVLQPSLMIEATAILMFGLYVSSFSTNPMRTIVAAVVAFAVGFWPGSRLAAVPEARRFLNGIRSRLFYGVFDDNQLAMRWLMIYAVELLVLALFVSLVFRFGLSNHRSAAPVGRHLVGQGLVIAFFMSLLAFVSTGGLMLGW